MIRKKQTRLDKPVFDGSKPVWQVKCIAMVDGIVWREYLQYIPHKNGGVAETMAKTVTLSHLIEHLLEQENCVDMDELNIYAVERLCLSHWKNEDHFSTSTEFHP